MGEELKWSQDENNLRWLRANADYFEAQFCKTGVISFIDYDKYRKEGHKFADPKTKIVQREIFRRYIAGLTPPDWYALVCAIGRDRFKFINICSEGCPIKAPPRGVTINRCSACILKNIST